MTIQDLDEKQISFRNKNLKAIELIKQNLSFDESKKQYYVSEQDLVYLDAAIDYFRKRFFIPEETIKANQAIKSRIINQIKQKSKNKDGLSSNDRMD